MQQISLIKVAKSFGATLALREASFTAYRGEVVAICGENGAGKSTLMSILAGSRMPTLGHIEINGKTVLITSPHDAFDRGIRTVYQELSLLPDLSVAENLFLGELPVNGWGRIDWATLWADAGTEMVALGMPEIDVRRPAGDYPVAVQQMFEIAKAIRNKPELLILDEPTGVLTQRETDLLFAKIAELKAAGTIIFYISHRMEEVLEISDRVVVLKDGRSVDEAPADMMTHDRIIQSMVGRPLEKIYPPRVRDHGPVRMSVQGLRAPGVHDVSFDLKAGEILGFCGLVGSGRSEVMRAIFGADPRQGGDVVIDGVPLNAPTPKRAMAAGLGFVTEERKVDGLALDADVLDNAGLASMSRISRGPVLNRRAQRDMVFRQVQKLDLRPLELSYILRRMSGGNQQKVILAKWLLMQGLKVLILDEPTRGVDIATKVEIYRLIADLAAQGMGILLISSEMPEILGLAHRLCVMNSGRIVAEMVPEETNEHEIFVAAATVERPAA
ncbi:hypothetical protein ACMU_18360 [Actibacterium mucosum KCTC 23349]|uniref:ABC transporter domain-containing protein n=1 Tax=Actibacterium mucosum KCTC 23349 TaxID=1454373 RepID=A0A037ZFV7_9RHOB|nr:sugar ABC transporter ATP-binding protein [Actibacterium mucosum]KAJ54391.1 hypothetical protein ACMU_18360 [Actibacterium mucosum KCTC 23349]